MGIWKAILLAAAVPIWVSAASAAVIDMEGFAPLAGSTTESPLVPRAFGDFLMTSPHGHFVDSAHKQNGTRRPDNGTDYYLHDSSDLFSVARADGAAFSFQSVDATEYFDTIPTGQTLLLIGFYLGGGTISQSFTTDASVLSFETFTVSGDWTNLIRLELGGSSGLAWDNVVLDMTNVPLPGSGVLILGALGVLALRGRRKA